MGKHIFTAFFSLLMLNRNDCSAQNLVNDSIALKLKTVIGNFKNQTNSASLTVVIIHGDEIIFSEALGYRDLEKKIPATIDSRYPVMSVTKTFTATMLMQLVEKGVVRLDDSVRKYIPEFKAGSDFDHTAPTTLLQLATHTSGLQRNSQADLDYTLSCDQWFINGGKGSIKWFPPVKEALKALPYVRIEYPPYHYLSPGGRHYSNLGYFLLGLSLERASKTEYPAYIMENICRPLQMTNTGCLEGNEKKDLVAKGYWYNPSTRSLVNTPHFQPHSAMYAGGMYSSARDLCRYLSFHCGDSFNNVLGVDPRAMMRFFKISWRQSYPLVLHEGGILGYSSIIAFNPELRIGWVILDNTNEVKLPALSSQISDIITPLYYKDNHALEQYAGTYNLQGGYGRLKIYLENDTLYSTYLEEQLSGKPLIPEGGNLFRTEAGNGRNIYYEFVPGNDSKIKAVNMGQLVWYREAE